MLPVRQKPVIMQLLPTLNSKLDIIFFGSHEEVVASIEVVFSLCVVGIQHKDVALEERALHFELCEVVDQQKVIRCCPGLNLLPILFVLPLLVCRSSLVLYPLMKPVCFGLVSHAQVSQVLCFVTQVTNGFIRAMVNSQGRENMLHQCLRGQWLNTKEFHLLPVSYVQSYLSLHLNTPRPATCCGQQLIDNL